MFFFFSGPSDGCSAAKKVPQKLTPAGQPEKSGFFAVQPFDGVQPPNGANGANAANAALSPFSPPSLPGVQPSTHPKKIIEAAATNGTN